MTMRVARHARRVTRGAMRDARWASSSSSSTTSTTSGAEDDAAATAREDPTPRRRCRPTSMRGMLAHIGATEGDLDVSVRVVWPGPIMKWPRPYDIGEEEVARGDAAAARAARAWAEKRSL